MTPSSELVFSNNLCAAFLTAIVKSFEEHHPKGYLGRTAMQKLTYFLKVLGVPVPCSFGIYTYGPYSDTVTFTIESLLADGVIEDTSSQPKYSNYRLSVNANELLRTFEGVLSANHEKIDRTVKALAAFEAAQLELISTLHFIAKRQMRIGLNPSTESLLREFKSIKKDKFPDEEIIKWHDALVEAGLIAS